MASPRANWKGFLKIEKLTCPVALYTAVSTSERVAFHTLNRATGHRVRRQFIDSDTGDVVEAAEQVKGYETGQGEYVVLEPDEITAAIPESDKTLDVDAFVRCGDIEDVYFDRPYYLAPANPVAMQAFGLVRDGLKNKGVAALARTVLFRRVRTLLIRAHGVGLIANTLKFDYEVRSAREAFRDIADVKIEGEMLKLADHIIKSKQGDFDPKSFDDRYEAALEDLVKAKLAGKKIEIRTEPEPSKVVDLMEALRRSAGTSGSESSKSTPRTRAGTRKPKRARRKTAAAPRRKAG
jgi:DNA end-binding protein Ku